MSYNEKDGIHRLLQFILGAVIGTASGYGAWTSFSDYPLWIFILAGSLGLGLAAAIWGDRLWHSLKGVWPW
jgi:hypothetical protein